MRFIGTLAVTTSKAILATIGLIMSVSKGPGDTVDVDRALGEMTGDDASRVMQSGL